LGSVRWCSIRYKSQRGQTAIELAFQIPILIIILAGGIQLARVFYTYHTLEKALRGGAGLLARTSNVNYCDASDTAITGAKNFVIYGNLQGIGTPIVPNLGDFLQVQAERQDSTSTTVNTCPCGSADADDCDISVGGRPPDFIVVHLGTGYPLQFPFAYLTLTTLNLKVSVRMPVTGG
jgi:hypothetical protein